MFLFSCFMSLSLSSLFVPLHVFVFFAVFLPTRTLFMSAVARDPRSLSYSERNSIYESRGINIVQTGRWLVAQILFRSCQFFFTLELLIVFGLSHWTNRTLSSHVEWREQRSCKIGTENSGLGRSQAVERGGRRLKPSVKDDQTVLKISH